MGEMELGLRQEANPETPVAPEIEGRPIRPGHPRVYSFSGFPEAPVHHLYLHHDGYPTGGRVPGCVPQQPARRRSPRGPRAGRRCRLSLRGVELCTGVDPQLTVQGWRRFPGSGTWHLRCGPMALTIFIERFLPGGVEVHR